MNGVMSEYLPIIAGVPQGSILGPILFDLYVNELPSMCHHNCLHLEANIGTRENLFGEPCNECGRFITFADDSTIVLQGVKGEERQLSMKIDAILLDIEDFLVANNLKLNVNKTQLLRTASRQQHVGNNGERVLLDAVDDKGDNIAPKESAKLLGVTLYKTLSWREYLEVGKSAMVPNLKRKLGALKFTSKFASRNAKIKLAHGVIMSKIIYAIQVWGLHCRPSVLRKVQTVQNNTMKWITGLYNASTKDLLINLDWMSVYQLSIYHSVLLQWKVWTRCKPERLIKRLNSIENTVARINLTERIWSRVSTRYYRSFENVCNSVYKISILKRILSEWIKSNVSIAEDQ